MRRFTRLFTPALVLIAVTFSLTVPARAQYPGKNPERAVRGPKAELTRLQDKAPGNSAIVYLNDGTLRGGWVKSVDDTHMHLEKQGETIDLAISEIATVRVQRPNRTPLYTILGYALTGTVAMLIAKNDGEDDFKDLAVVFGVSGIPGGLLGGFIGKWTTGDIEVVP